MKKINIPVLIEIDEDGYYIVSCPTIKGCHSYGENIDEAISNIKEAIEVSIEDQEMQSTNKYIGIRDLEITINA